jgi:hypothetical protein
MCAILNFTYNLFLLDYPCQLLTWRKWHITPYVGDSFAQNHILNLFLHQTLYFLVIFAKNIEIIISSFNSKLGDLFTTPGSSPNQLEHIKLIRTYISLEATIYIIYLYIFDKI